MPSSAFHLIQDESHPFRTELWGPKAADTLGRMRQYGFGGRLVKTFVVVMLTSRVVVSMMMMVMLVLAVRTRVTLVMA